MTYYLGNAAITLISLPGIVATAIYIVSSWLYMRKRGLRFSVARAAFWALMILPSIFTVVPEKVEGGWKLGPATCAFVAILVSVLAIGAQGIAGQYPKWNAKVDPLLTKFAWPEMLFLLTIAQALGDVYGAIRFSTPAHIGTIGGAGWLDGLVWVPPMITGLYAGARYALGIPSKVVRVPHRTD